MKRIQLQDRTLLIPASCFKKMNFLPCPRAAADVILQTESYLEMILPFLHILCFSRLLVKYWLLRGDIVKSHIHISNNTCTHFHQYRLQLRDLGKIFGLFWNANVFCVFFFVCECVCVCVCVYVCVFTHVECGGGKGKGRVLQGIGAIVKSMK